MIKFLIMDVDGTLTDGKIYMGNNGELFKAFDIKDGCGIKDLLPLYDIIPVIITARNSELLKKRCEELGVKELHQGVRDKLDCLRDIIKKYNQDNLSNYNLSNCAYIGDDILDLQCMISISKAGGKVGCPYDAVDSVYEIADFISTKKSGSGAVREFIEYLIEEKSTCEISVDEKISFVIEHINLLDFEKLEIGRYDLSNGIYYMVQEYTTRPASDCGLESHKKYIDIQWIIDGQEMIQVANINRLKLKKEYDFDNDIMFWEIPKHICSCVLSKNSYLVLYPNDAHRPSLYIGSSNVVKKIVVKIPC